MLRIWQLLMSPVDGNGAILTAFHHRPTGAYVCLHIHSANRRGDRVQQRIVVGTRVRSPAPPQAASPSPHSPAHRQNGERRQTSTTAMSSKTRHPCHAHPQASAWPCSDRATRLCMTEPGGAGPPGHLPPAGEPDSVSCPTASFCMAVDARDSSAFVFNGRSWSSAPRINDPASSTQTGMASVSCPAPSFCAAVDNGSNAFTFNGTSWSPGAVIDPGND